MRAFVAVSPPPEVREAVVERARGLRYEGEVRWLPPENVHLTLKFLGEVPEDALAAVSAALDGACGEHGPFGVELPDFGAFPSRERAKAVWAAVGAGSGELGALAADIEGALEGLGFPREKRPYLPHATVGRARGRPARLPEAEATGEPLGFRVRSVELVRSRLLPSGAVYSVLSSSPLGDA
ncbi:MAG: RNA 2',3'-cyclic phosphodiesterase [Rubrobacter sp.]|nr:RNA 2',3'-cyclic phosphodiesterase [Rubrobacter sp.]